MEVAELPDLKRYLRFGTIFGQRMSSTTTGHPSSMKWKNSQTRRGKRKLSLEDIQSSVSKTRNWKVTSLELVQDLQFKVLTNFQPKLQNFLQGCGHKGIVPELIVKRRTVLVRSKGVVISNYRSIGFLSKMQKFLTRVIGRKLYDSFERTVNR